MGRTLERATCRWCGQFGNREFDTEYYKDGAGRGQKSFTNEYCKMCKNFEEKYFARDGREVSQGDFNLQY